MAETEILLFGAIVALAALARVVTRALALPSTAGYVAAGFFARPFVPHDTPLLGTVLLLALAFLLFASGVRFGEAGLAHAHLRSGLLLGLAPSLLVGLMAAFIASSVGWANSALPYVAIATAFSSTLLAVQWLTLEGERRAAPAGSALAGLLAQDALMLLALALLPALARPMDLPGDALGLVLLLIATAVVAVVARRQTLWRLLPDLELRVLSAFALAFGFMLLAATLGVPPAAGAFLAGLAVAPFPARLHVRPAVATARDFFTPLFLVVLGASFPLPVWADLPLLALLTLLVVVVKPVLVALAGRVAGLPARSSARIAASMGQATEFALPLILIGAEAGALAEREAALLGWLVALTLLLSALAQRTEGKVLLRLLPTEKAPPDAPTRDHVVLLGAGTTGRRVAQQLVIERQPVLAVDVDSAALARLPSEVARLRGDAADPDLLDSAGIQDANAVVVLLHTDEMTHEVLALVEARVQRDRCIVIYRAHDPEHFEPGASRSSTALAVGEAVADAVERHLRAPDEG